MITFVLAAAVAVTVSLYGVPLRFKTVGAAQKAGISSAMPVVTGHVITLCGAIAFAVLGLVSTFAWARWARAALDRFIGAAYGSIVRYVLILLGMCLVGIVTLGMLGFSVAQLILGGAVTGVLITIAAQQSLSNLFAGVMLQFAQPFRVGDRVRISAGALGGTIEGMVSEVSITYVTLDTEDGRVLLPNAQVLAAAVSPMRSAPNNGVFASRHGFLGRSAPRPPMANAPQQSAQQQPTQQQVDQQQVVQSQVARAELAEHETSRPSDPDGQPPHAAR